MWYKTDTNTGRSVLTPVLNWVAQFKKWLDLAGGVRLTYKIDFSKYESLYESNQSQLLQVKKFAQDVILKNIDDRISKLWVSDYNSYVQKLSDGEYVVVEIWWVQDLDAAKKIIGKTVELEFKVPNEAKENDPAVYAARQKLAEDLFAVVVKNPSSMKDLAASRGSQDVSYNAYDEVELSSLPMFYRNNLDKLVASNTGVVFPELFTWLYHMSINASEDGQINAQSLEGFTMVLFKDKKVVDVEELALWDLLAYAEKNNFKVERSVQRAFEWKTNDITYNTDAKTLIYVSEQELPQEEWYDVSIFKILSGGDVAASLEGIKNGERINVEEILKWWQSTTEIKKYVPSFVYNDKESVSSFTELDGAYIVKVRDAKAESDSIFPTAKIKVANETQANNIIDSLKKKTLYSFEDVFVSDKLRWVPATDPKTNEVLNGSYFELANVGQSQTGKPVVSIQFNDKGKEIFCNLTEQYIGKQMAIFVGWEEMTAPVIRDKICWGSAQIDWAFDIKWARALADDLNSWALPAPLLLSHEETVAPSLGQSALNWALLAGLFGLIIVYLILVAFYGWKKATVALLGLIAFLIYLLWGIKLFGVVSSLSGIAAIVLSLGMAVDANVIMYERIREELKTWKSMNTAIEDWYERSWAPIRDGNVTTWIIWLLLFIIWVNVFKGFGTMMLINMILILVVVTPLTKELLLIFYKNKK